MRFEIILFGITAFILANMYTEGKYWKLIVSWKKYWQMLLVVVGALMIYLLMKYNPLRAQQIISTSNEYIKYLPLDKSTSDFISPILDFTSKQNFYQNQFSPAGNGIGSLQHPILNMNPNSIPPQSSESRIINSGGNMKGGKATKRSVSETKKKFVASRQNWKCGECQQQLNAWFEVDHKIRLEYGGSNHIDNLVALCRECHGKKTTIENL
jgi:hypothetical protein